MWSCCSRRPIRPGHPTTFFGPDAHFQLDSALSVSVEYARKARPDDDPPILATTSKVSLRTIMPIDYMPEREMVLPPTISSTRIKPYRKRLLALLEAERVNEMMTNAAYAIEREVPNETLAIADHLWFGEKRPSK